MSVPAMSALAANPRTVVVDHGGTPWWVPLLTALVVAAAAAAASCYATWRFKTADVNRESALRAADLVDEAEQLASFAAGRTDETAATTERLLQQARIRAQSLNDPKVDDRFRAAIGFISELRTWQPIPGRSWHWLREAIANVREGLVPHLRAPRLVRGHPPADAARLVVTRGRRTSRAVSAYSAGRRGT
jgi:hypothetical protein